MLADEILHSLFLMVRNAKMYSLICRNAWTAFLLNCYLLAIVFYKIHWVKVGIALLAHHNSWFEKILKHAPNTLNFSKNLKALYNWNNLYNYLPLCSQQLIVDVQEAKCQ